MAVVNKSEPVVVAESVDKAAKEHEQQNKRRMEEKKQAAEARKKKRDEMIIQIQDILFEFGGLESNVPVNHGYWDLINAFRAISREVGGDDAN